MLSLNPEAFFGTAMKKTLYTLRPYDAGIHNAARLTKDYSALAVDITPEGFSDRSLTQLEIPRSICGRF